MKPNKLRKLVLNMVYDKKSGHIGGSFSLAELICFLYDNYDLAHTASAPGDILILSKGHAAPILYAAQIEAGLFPESQINTFRDCDSPFQGHVDPRYNKYIHALTGSLGQGLSIACGIALSRKLKGDQSLVFCIIGDGELNEGQNYEALMFAHKYALSNLIVILDNNGLQNDDTTENTMPIYNLHQIIEGFGLQWISIDGHNTEALLACKELFKSDYPKFINLNTIKGKGVSFMENSAEWHSKIPSEEQYNKAMEELS